MTQQPSSPGDIVERLDEELAACKRKGWHDHAAFLRDVKAEIERLRRSGGERAAVGAKRGETR